MFTSLTAKIFAMVAGLLLVVAGIVMTSSRDDVIRTMRASDVEAAESTLRLVEINIAGRYHSLLTERVRTVTDRRTHLQEIIGVVTRSLDEISAQVDRGTLSEQDGRTNAAKLISDLRFDGDSEYVFAFDQAGIAIAYPEAGMVGHDLSSFRDYRGRDVVASAWDEAGRYGRTFLTYRWKELGQDNLGMRFGLFVPLPRWNWMLAVTVDVQDVERDFQLKTDEFRSELRGELPKLPIARTGYIFLFDGKGNVLVPPQGGLDLQATNTLTGHSLFEDITAAAKAGTRTIEHRADANGELFQSHLWFFKPFNWYVVAVTSVSEIERPAEELIRRQALIFGAVLVLGLLLAFFFARRLSRPLVRLTRYANSLSKTDFSEAGEGRSGAIERLAAHYKDEVGHLARAFAHMEKSLRINVRRVLETTAAKERIESELNVARDIQIGILPKIFPQPGANAGFELHADLKSAKEVGGDLYDFFYITPAKFCFAIGDVSGKGVPAALFMAICKTLVKAASEHGADPAEMMRRVNDELSRDNPNLMFVTLLIAILDVESGAIQYVNAGHNPPILLNIDGTARYLRGISGPACGVMEDLTYDTLEMRLEPGESLVLYTDGVTEAMDPANEQFGEEPLLSSVAAESGARPREIIDNVTTAVRAHADDAPQSDDITMLVVKYAGPDEKFGEAPMANVVDLNPALRA